MGPHQLPPFQQKPKPGRFIILGVLGGTVLIAIGFMFRHAPVKILRPSEPEVIISTGSILAGSVFATSLIKAGIKPTYISHIEKTVSQKFDLRKIQPGHTFEIISSTAGIFKQLTYRKDSIHFFTVTRSTQGVYSYSEKTEKTVWVKKRVKGEITEFFYRDLMKQGHPESFVANLIGDLADNIFAWRIDFFTEQRPGDKFDILLEQEFIAGSDKPLWNGRGRILVATYAGKATKVKENVAIRYTEPGSTRPEYYDSEGNAVRKAFLRAPFTHGAFRVSSRFNPKRFHPILRVYRPHHGTDYAAARGTPVASIGKGTVVRAEWYKGYGNCVDVRHTAKFTSRYGHLSRIAVRRGQSINQGQYLGNVGSTGLSTGPHLHFEMLVDGAQRNFLTMTFPSASAVTKNNMPEFSRVRDQALQELHSLETEPPKKSEAKTAS